VSSVVSNGMVINYYFGTDYWDSFSGASLQNNFRELSNLLHFIESKEINAEELEEECGDGNLINENVSCLCFSNIR
jgi:hypothetical protein